MIDLKRINKELKSYVNQASFISQKTRNKVIKILGNKFEIDLPIENFANIDVQLTKDGNIIMRGDEYKSPKSLSEQEILEKYNSFAEEANDILNKREISYYNKKMANNVLNIFIAIGLSIAYLVIIFYLIKAILHLQLFRAGILATLLSTYLVPNIRDCFEQAKNFLKRTLKKKK